MNTEERLKKMMDAARIESDPTVAEWDAFTRKAHRSLYSRRAATVVGAVALIAAGAFAAIFLTSNPVDEPSLAPATTPTAEPSPTEQEEPAAVEVAASEQELWFVADERLWWGTTVMGGEVPAGITVEGEVARPAFWLHMLLAGPGGPVLEDGGTSAIPEGTQLLGVERRGDSLRVDLSSEFTSGGGSLSMQLRVAQVVYTATQFPGIERVFFRIDGEDVDAIGGEGVIVGDGVARRDFQEGYIAPNVVVEMPRPGDEFASGDVISGFANVFEANVNLRVLDADGNAIFEGFTTATCGSGCWGDFEEALTFEIGTRQEGRVEALTFSAEDGSEQDVVSIPVILVP